MRRHLVLLYGPGKLCPFIRSDLLGHGQARTIGIDENHGRLLVFLPRDFIGHQELAHLEEIYDRGNPPCPPLSRRGIRNGLEEREDGVPITTVGNDTQGKNIREPNVVSPGHRSFAGPLS